MKTKTAILFYAKKTRVNKKGLCAIYTRITVNGKRIEFSTGRMIAPDKWSSAGGKVKGHSNEARSINRHLDILKPKQFNTTHSLITFPKAQGKAQSNCKVN